MTVRQESNLYVYIGVYVDLWAPLDKPETTEVGRWVVIRGGRNDLEKRAVGFNSEQLRPVHNNRRGVAGGFNASPMGPLGLFYNRD
jgi:hypothetical protein